MTSQGGEFEPNDPPPSFLWVSGGPNRFDASFCPSEYHQEKRYYIQHTQHTLDKSRALVIPSYMAASRALVLNRNKHQQNRLAEIENIRANLPIAEYLVLVNQAIQTGRMPLLDRNGRPTGEFTDLEGKDRMNLLLKMIDKALPAKPATPSEMGEAEASLEEIQKIASDPDTIANLPLAQLEEMEASIKKAKEKK